MLVRTSRVFAEMVTMIVMLTSKSALKIMTIVYNISENTFDLQRAIFSKFLGDGGAYLPVP